MFGNIFICFSPASVSHFTPMEADTPPQQNKRPASEDDPSDRCLKKGKTRKAFSFPPWWDHRKAQLSQWFASTTAPSTRSPSTTLARPADVAPKSTGNLETPRLFAVPPVTFNWTETGMEHATSS